ncbi:MAG TPA: hypothetical protein DGT23_04635 [Micromonosporaceae bacterium]|nr:hypothetical protein [Micromonosporaceae bacterium]
MLPRVTRRQAITWWGAGAALLLFAVTGLIGALLKTGGPKQPWNVTIVSATVAADRPPLQRTDPANRWLVVTAKVEITGDSSKTGLASMLRLSGADGLLAPEPGVVLLRDGSRVDRLHPGLPEELAFAWEQAAASAAPQQLTVQVTGSLPITIAVTAP